MVQAGLASIPLLEDMPDEFGITLNALRWSVRSSHRHRRIETRPG
jgi:hypothetical protein